MEAFEGGGQGRMQNLLNLLSLFEICSKIPLIKKLVTLLVSVALFMCKIYSESKSNITNKTLNIIRALE